MATLSLELSDGLRALRECLAELARNRRPITSREAAALDRSCVLLEARARELECEVSRHRWNEAARKERRAAETARLLAETKRPGSNVKLFPVAPRPVPVHQPNGAA